MKLMPPRTTQLALGISAALALVGCSQAQQPTPRKSTGQDPAKLAKEALEILKKHKIEFDFKNKTITVPVVVNRPTDNIEYLLIYRSGKTHEAILITHAKPSVLNSAFILLGLKEGRNFELKDKDPMPSEADLRKGVSPYVPILPKGHELFMTVSMQLEKGGTKVMAVEDLVADLHTGRAVADTKWIYLGGRMAEIYRNEPKVFMADVEGNLVSTCYMMPKNHLLTMIHERSRDDQNWWLSEACPPPGTKMKLTFHVNKPSVIVEREKRIAKNKGKGKGKAASLPDPGSGKVPRPTSRKNN